MSNIFKSKEIYKKIPVKVNPNKPIVALRGLYVAGKYRAPYWIDAVLNIRQLSTTRAADVVYYTTREDKITDYGCISMIQFDIDATNFKYAKLTTAQASTKDIGCLSMIQFDMTSTNFAYRKYATKNASNSDYGCLSMIQFDMDATNFAYTPMTKTENSQPPGQPVLNITNMTSTSGVIT